MAGYHPRFVLGVASIGLALTALLLVVYGGWTVVCPETQHTGFMDCAWQPDAVWRSDLPGWVSLELLFGCTLFGAAGFALAVVLKLWSWRPRFRTSGTPPSDHARSVN